MSKAATEGQVSYLHALVTRLHVRRLERMLQQLDEEDVPAEIAIDDKYMRVVQKWVTDNGILASPDSESGGGLLAEKVARIREGMKGRVLNFKAEAADRGLG